MPFRLKIITKVKVADKQKHEWNSTLISDFGDKKESMIIKMKICAQVL